MTRTAAAAQGLAAALPFLDISGRCCGAAHADDPELPAPAAVAGAVAVEGGQSVGWLGRLSAPIFYLRIRQLMPR